MFYLVRNRNEARLVAESLNMFLDFNNSTTTIEQTRALVARLSNFGTWAELEKAFFDNVILDTKTNETEIENARSVWISEIASLNSNISKSDIEGFFNQYFPRKPKRIHAAKFLENPDVEFYRAAVGLHEIYRPVITQEETHLGAWTMLTSTTDAPKLILKFNEDGEFSALSEQQFGPYNGEVSIPALLTHLHYQGQIAEYEGRNTRDDVYWSIVRTFEFFMEEALTLLLPSGAEFTEMTYNASVCLAAAENIVLATRLADAEEALRQQNAPVDSYFKTVVTNPGPELTQYSRPATSEFVTAAEKLLSHFRAIVPREPDNSISHYYHALPEIAATGRPPKAVIDAILDHKSSAGPSVH